VTGPGPPTIHTENTAGTASGRSVSHDPPTFRATTTESSDRTAAKASIPLPEIEVTLARFRPGMSIIPVIPHSPFAPGRNSTSS
jgi:hypothetical protein